MSELRDRIRAGSGKDTKLDTDIAVTLNPSHTGKAPSYTDDLVTVINEIESRGFIWRIGHDRLGDEPPGETRRYFCVVRDLSDSLKRRVRDDANSAIELERAAIDALLKALGK